MSFSQLLWLFIDRFVEQFNPHNTQHLYLATPYVSRNLCVINIARVTKNWKMAVRLKKQHVNEVEKLVKHFNNSK